MNKIKVMERVTDDFLKFTYNKLNEIDSSKMCVEPWPPSKSVSADGFKLHYRFPRSTHLLDVVLHKDLGENIGPYIELLYELANHVDSFHSAGWIFRCLRAKHVWILKSKTREQLIVVPKFGKYRMIVSSEFDAHLEQIKVDSREEMEGVQWLPIEAIKACLYSKESDVYAYGMVTWEVMTAFGQQGVVYDEDEEQELSCIPFNYQQSENILQHLIEGYIPEKPVKCPDWFYREVTRPCLLHQKIDRPSMKTVLQILQTRLGKTLPKQILGLPPSGLVNPKGIDEYADIYDFDDCVTSSMPSKFDNEDSIKPLDDKANPLVVKRKPPPPPIINMDKKDCHDNGRRRPPPPLPPLPQKPSKIESDMSDCSIPLVPRRYIDTTNPQESEDDNGYETRTSAPKRPPVVLREKKEDSANPSDVNSCKSLPLPMKPPQSNENEAEDQDVHDPQINPISSQQQTKEALNSAKKPPLPPKPSKPNSTDANSKTELGKDGSCNTTELPVSARNIPPNPPEQHSVSPNENQSTLCGSKTRTDQSNSLDSVYNGSDFYGTVPSVMSDDMRETFKGSDFNSSDNVSIGLGDTHKGSDFNSSDNLGDTHNGSNIDRTLRAAKDKSIGSKPTLAIKTKPIDFPKPKANPKSTFYVNDHELKADDISTPVYVNQNQPETKPAVPPRKPLNK